jgi:hypothetical protein
VVNAVLILHGPHAGHGFLGACSQGGVLKEGVQVRAGDVLGLRRCAGVGGTLAARVEQRLVLRPVRYEGRQRALSGVISPAAETTCYNDLGCSNEP